MKSLTLQLTLIGVWAVAAGAGFILLLNYKNDPGARGVAALDWPVDTRLIRDAHRPNLVIVLHPQCPCSQASLEQLDRILTRFAKPVRTTAILFRPAAADDWDNTAIVRRVLEFPGVTAHADPGGIDARCFGVKTSGHVLLYSADGRLLFSGGITSGRGHAGDNPGADALLQLLTGAQRDRIDAPVFGCPLEDDAVGKGPRP